jgi:hypothetical protein
MKIKTNYYCLVDSNNKPDFRYIFKNKKDAEKKRQQIKNSLTGETLFVSKNKRDFFIDGIKKDFISPDKKIDIKKGCWATLKTKKISLLDTISPETYFTKVIQESNNFSISPVNIEIEQPIRKKVLNKKPISNKTTINNSSKTYTPKPPLQNTSTSSTISKTNSEKKRLIKKSITTPKKTFSRLPTLEFYKNFSLLNSRIFIGNFAMLLIICLGFILYNNNISNKELAKAISKKQQKIIAQKSNPHTNISVLGAMDKKTSPVPTNLNTDNIDKIVFDTLSKFEEIKADQLEESIKKMVAGTPMEKMAPYIAKKDKIVAAFLVGISKKESNYGRRVPVLNGQDCFNYWGYRGKRKRMGTGGHTCFDSPEDAVETVGGRIERLVKSGVDTPEEMVLWKCGSNCNATGGWPAARKWIADVNMYYTKMLNTASNDEKASEKIKVLESI